MNLENRKTRRRIVEHPAAVLDRDGSVLCLCTMKDVSATGAKLEVVMTGAPDQLKLPDEFTLLLSKSGKVRRQCEISWRSENAVGVRFTK